MPGYKKEDIHLHLDGDVLTMEAERNETVTEEKPDYYHKERSWGKVKRTFKLPNNCSTQTDPEVKYENGVLNLVFQKAGPPSSRKLTVA